MSNYSLGEAVLGTLVDLTGLRSGLGQAKGESQSAIDRMAGALKNGLGFIGGAAIAGATAAIGGLTAILGVSINEAMDAQKVMAQTEAVIKSTGSAAGMSAQQISDLAGALSTQSTFSDDAIQSAENLLLTFTNIGKDTFPLATQAMVDMAAAMNTDVQGGAIQLGKALNDPIAGISALSRVGVTFTEDQKKVIEQLVKTGDVAGAQKIILAELNKEFGGSAAAQAQTFAGSLEVVKNQLLNAAEGIGTSMLPALQGFMTTVVTPAIPVITQLAGIIGGFITDTIAGGGDFGAALDGLHDSLMGVVSPETLAIVDTFGSALLKLFRGELPGALQPVADAARNVAAAFSESMPMIQANVGQALEFVKAQFAAIGPVLIGNVTTFLNSLASFWRAHGDEIMGAVRVAFQFVTVTIGGTLTLISGLVTSAMQVLNGNWSGAWQTVKTTLTTFLNSALSIVGTDLNTFVGTWRTNFEMAKTIVATIFTDIVTGIKTKISEFVDAGRNLALGIRDGIKSAVQDIIDSAVNAVRSAIDAAKRAVGIHSPSAMAAQEVGSPVGMGIVQGLMDTLPDIRVAAQSAARTAIADSNQTNFYLTAQYGLQDERSLKDDIGLLQLLYGSTA